MRNHYDFEKLQGVRNPYADRLTQSVALAVPHDVAAYFQALADEQGVGIERVMVSYLQDCMARKRRLVWQGPSGRRRTGGSGAG